MKKLILLSFLLIFSITQSQAQYESLFGQNTTEWVFEWSNSFGTFQDTLYIEKDTFVNNILYKKIMCDYSPYPGGLLREDTTTGRVWYRQLSQAGMSFIDTTEYLSFDYSLMQGDTFPVGNVMTGPPNTGSYPPNWDIVDTVYYKNGKKYIEFEGVDFYGEPFTLIEGVGGNIGAIWKTFMSSMLGHYLLCSYKDGAQASYTNSRYNGDCDKYPSYYSTNFILNVNEEKLHLYPNPVIQELNIINKSSLEISRIQIFNNMGQLLKSLLFQHSIDLSFLPSGTYQLVLITEKEQLIPLSIIKE